MISQINVPHTSRRICLQDPLVLRSRLRSLGQVQVQVFSVFPSFPRYVWLLRVVVLFPGLKITSLCYCRDGNDSPFDGHEESPLLFPSTSMKDPGKCVSYTRKGKEYIYLCCRSWHDELCGFRVWCKIMTWSPGRSIQTDCIMYPCRSKTKIIYLQRFEDDYVPNPQTVSRKTFKSFLFISTTLASKDPNWVSREHFSMAS